MAYLNQQEAFEHFRDQVIEGLKTIFPVRGRSRSLHLEQVEVVDDLHPNDIQSQYDAKVNGKSWASTLKATLSLRENDTGKVLDTHRVNLMELPKQTSRYSYIVDGQEYQIDNQWQLKPGVYARRRQNGELEAQFNVEGRSAFRLSFDPKTKLFYVDYKKAAIPAYPLMRALGVTDESLSKSWGKDILAANQTARRVAGAVEQFYKTSTGEAPPSKEAAEDYLKRTLSESRLRPEVTQITLGKPFEYVTGETLHLAANKLLAVQQGAPEDDRDSLVFKSLRSVGDFVQDQIKRSSKNIALKVQRQLNSGRAEKVRDVVRPELFNEPIRHIFHKTAIANPAKQINPLEMISSAMQTTIMGPGGITSSRQIVDEAKMINPSHIGFLDPINTPEGEKTGVTLRLPIGVQKVGNEAKIPVLDLRSGKPTYISPAQMLASKVVLPDQYEWKNGKPTPISPTVKAIGKGNAIEDVKFAEADYAMRHPSQLFNLTSNLIPFMGNNSGGRAGMASRHMEQAISLLHREAPLVQVATPVNKPGMDTFERVVGQQVAHTAPAAGTVKSVEPGAITIAGDDGKEYKVHCYNYYPLNDAKSFLHSTPLVKPGDKVQANQVIADTNYSKGGTLALGTNLRVAYVPYKGYNFEDGVVISESAAKKLSSVHMHKYELEKDDRLIHDPKLFQVKHLGAFRPEQYEKLGTDGVVRVGTRVKPGDPLILAMQPYEIKDRTGLAAIRKSLTGQHTDRTIRWDSDFEGEVVKVHKTGSKISVHVRTIEPMQVGDKIAGRYGNKGIVTLVLPDDQMPHDKNGKPVEVLLNPSGVPGRMNIGQVLETAVGKIAEKTGKPYVVNNFDPKVPNYLEKVKSELKKHGLSDTEQLFDPVTKQPLGHALVGPQYTMKLVHQVDKKLSVRSGMGLPGISSTEGYDSVTLQPAGGGSSGGQTIGALGMYALLAHGAKANIREMQSWKSEGADPQTNEAKRWPSQHIEVWKAIQEGTPLPPPKPTFAFHRFTQMLQGAGINIEKKGHEFVLGPLTDKHILQMSAGELKNPSRAVRTKLDKSGEYQPIAGGIFDEKITGGHGGTKWSHISLAEPVPNPVFEGAIKRLTGLTQKKFDQIVSGEVAINPATGATTDLGVGVTGGQAIKALLSKIDVDKELEKARKDLLGARSADVDRHLKKVKYLQALQNLGIKNPADAYILHYLPILPPVIRPLSVMQSGALRYEDINGLYMQFAQVNDKLKDPILSTSLSAKQKRDLRAKLYDGVKAIMGTGPKNEDSKQKGLLEQIAGTQPKCFDGETEVLTEDGWVRLDEYDGLAPLATVNLGTDTFEWQAPSAFHVTPYKGKMHRLEGRHINLLVTPNHNHVLSRCTQRKGVRMWEKWALVPSHTMVGAGKGNRARLMTAAKNWNGTTPAYVFDGHAVAPDAFASFVGWWLAEGWISSDGRYAYIAQSSPEGIRRVDAVFRELGLPYYRKAYAKDACTTGSVTYWRVGNKDLLGWLLRHIGDGCENKRLSAEILNWEQKHLRLLLDGYLRGDGDNRARSRRKTEGKRTHWRMDALSARFSTASQKLMDDLQHLAVKAGLCVSAPKPTKKRKAHHFQNYRATVRGFRDVSFGEHLRIREESFTGLVYGPTVPNGTVVVRRRGVVCVSGNSGYFQKTLINRRQDLTMRSTIVPEPSLGLDEVGLPKDAALTLFRPFVVRQLVLQGTAPNALEAQRVLADHIKGKQDVMVWRALDQVMKERPVLLKRDPALHKYSVQAFQAKAVEGNAIKIHPLVTGGFNADFDGDTMAVFVPISHEAVREARQMFPSNNIFNETSGRVMYQPTLESALGLYKLSLVGQKTSHSFASREDAAEALRAGKVRYDDVVKVAGIETTPGRVLLANVLPPPLQKKVLTDFNYKIDKKGLDSLLTSVAKDYRHEFGRIVNSVKDLGYDASFGVIKTNLVKGNYIPIGTHSLSLKDFEPDIATREKALSAAHKQVAAIRKSTSIPEGDKERRIVGAYLAASSAMDKAHKEIAQKQPTNLSLMERAGVKPSWEQYKQMVLAPVVMQDSKNNFIATPVTKSYAEGLDTAGYWTQMHGARRGAVMKVQEVQEPGYMSKLLMNSSMNLLVDKSDCGTTRGLALSTDEPDIHDRYLASDFKSGKLHVPAGTLLTPDLVGQIRAADKNAKLLVRSPLKCESEKGLCQKCVGPSVTGQAHPLGTNIGVISANALGERAVQLTLKSFHSGGVAEVGGGSKVLSGFARFKQLTELPTKIPNAATLATASGKIEKIEHDNTGARIWIGGKPHFVGRDGKGMPLHVPLPNASSLSGYRPWTAPKVGMHVEAGTLLSDPNRTIVNPHTLYSATKSMDRVQNFLADEVYDLYRKEGVRRRTIETVVRAMSNLTKIEDPGDHPHVLRGEFYPTTLVRKWNQTDLKGRRPIVHKPVLKGVDMLPFFLTEDWMAKLQHARLQETLMDAAAKGQASKIHGYHPIPGIAYGASFGNPPADVRAKQPFVY